MPRTDRCSRLIGAPVARVFHALIDRQALERWLAPNGMTAMFERFDPTPGGSYRLILTYEDPSTAAGKSSADSDVVEGRYLDVVHNDRIVQAVDFVSDDPAFAGTMTMTWAVRPSDGGTTVDFVADDVPAGISAEDHAAGMASSLENLAGYVQSQEPSRPLSGRQRTLRRRRSHVSTTGPLSHRHNWYVVLMIPALVDGRLPAGDWTATWAEVEETLARRAGGCICSRGAAARLSR